MSTDKKDALPPPPPPPPPTDYSISDLPVTDQGQALAESKSSSSIDSPLGNRSGTLAGMGSLSPADVPVLDEGQPAPDLLTEAEFYGGRGVASGREFDLDRAGGPIRSLDASTAEISNEGVQAVADHLQRFVPGGELEPPEQGMLDRLSSIASGNLEPTQYDLNFYTHELDEAERYTQLGYGTGDIASPGMYDVWNNVHSAALEDYGLSDADLYHPDVAP